MPKVTHTGNGRAIAIPTGQKDTNGLAKFTEIKPGETAELNDYQINHVAFRGAVLANILNVTVELPPVPAPAAPRIMSTALRRSRTPSEALDTPQSGQL